MSTLRKVRVQLIDKVTKLPQEDVDVLTSAGSVYFPDGETFQDKWDKGEFRGDPGENGDDGVNATFKIGDVITVDHDKPATVENVGTMSAAILNFGIPRGPKGKDGTSIKILSRFDTYEDLVKAYPDGTGIDGGFLVGPENYACDYHFWNSINLKWESIGPIKGEKGDTGERGRDGTGLSIINSFNTPAQLFDYYPDGSVCGGSGCVTTNTGEYWYWNYILNKWVSIGSIMGMEGPQGIAGKAATIEIGNVNTVGYETRASVYNSGNNSEVVLNFNIPRGAPGVIPDIDSTITEKSVNPPSSQAVFNALKNKADKNHEHYYASSENIGGSAKRAVSDEDGNNIKTYANSLKGNSDNYTIALYDRDGNILSTVDIKEILHHISNDCPLESYFKII